MQTSSKTFMAPLRPARELHATLHALQGAGGLNLPHMTRNRKAVTRGTYDCMSHLEERYLQCTQAWLGLGEHCDSAGTVTLCVGAFPGLRTVTLRGTCSCSPLAHERVSIDQIHTHGKPKCPLQLRLTHARANLQLSSNKAQGVGTPPPQLAQLTCMMDKNHTAECAKSVSVWYVVCNVWQTQLWSAQHIQCRGAHYVVPFYNQLSPNIWS